MSIITEYDEARTMELFKEEYLAAGRAEGLEAGRAEAAHIAGDPTAERHDVIGSRQLSVGKKGLNIAERRQRFAFLSRGERIQRGFEACV